MPLNNFLTRWLAARIERCVRRVMAKRGPDFIVGGKDAPYLNRWWLIPRNPIFNVYLHEFIRDDEDRACHDHPWQSVSLALSGQMRELYLTRKGEVLRDVNPGDLLFRGARFSHRMIVPTPGALTLFITGPRVREWGFWCENKRFVPWKQFVSGSDRGAVGRGCD